MFDTRRSEYAKDLKRRREPTGNGSLSRSLSLLASDVANWKGPWAGYEGEKEDRMTSEEKVTSPSSSQS